MEQILRTNEILEELTAKNMDLFQQMIKLCRNSKMVPMKYVEDMNQMYNKCNCTQKNSINLCNLILKGVENISLMNENSFQHVANVYNALLELSKMETTSLQNENYIAGTSSITTGLENGTNNKSNEIFKEKQDSRRPVLNDISSNLQTNQNNNCKGKILITKPTIALTKPINRLASNLNRTTTSFVSKVKPSLNASKTVLNESISHISRAITRHKGKTVRTLKPYNGTITRSSSLRIKSAALESEIQIQKKDQEWITACNVDDVDKKNEFDPFFVGAYSKPIFDYLMVLENKHIIKPDYLINHKYITPSNRGAVIDWLVVIHKEFKMLQESLFTAVVILDRYLQENQNVTQDKFQLIGATCLLLACKYEEIYVPKIRTLIYLSDNAFTIEDVKSSLVDVFRALNYSLSRPVSLTFLRRFSKVLGAHRLHHILAKYFLELSLIDYRLVHIKPSEMAMSSLLLAIVVSNDPELDDAPKDIKEFLSIYWTDTMHKYSTYNMNDLISTIQAVAYLALNASECKYKAIYDKYQREKLVRSFTLRPAIRYIAHIR